MRTRTIATACLAGSLLTLLAAGVQAQDEPDGARLFQANCATCHAGDGRGRSVDEVGFDQVLPDFTQCDLTTPEPDSDWDSIIHEGGPIRGFSRIMPAFGDALTDDEINALIGYLRGLCREPDWPRGDLNFPLPLLTEKAFPENEALIEGNFKTAGDDSYEFKFIWEQRFGRRNQMELNLPIQRADLGDGMGWATGAGDLGVAVKHVLKHSLENGSILSVGGEYVLATGDETRGFGAESNRLESFLAYGKALPRDSFIQLQSVIEMPTDSQYPEEFVLRFATGKTLYVGNRFGRAYTPMIELQGTRENESGADTEWDIAPQIQISLSKRQHILAAAGFQVPVTQTTGRDTRFVFYLLWDWFDGGVLEGW
jgi:mono/diheme cytochrome c family protein